MQQGYSVANYMTDAEALSVLGQSLSNGVIIIIDNDGQPTGEMRLTGAAGSVPSKMVDEIQLSGSGTPEYFIAANEVAMLALSAKRGDWVLRSDLSTDPRFLLTGSDPTVLADWVRWTDDFTAGEKSALDAATTHSSNSTNPHIVTKTQVGLANVDNTSDANKPVSTNQQSAIDLHANSVTNPHVVTKTQVGLANIDNTSDASKPVSTAQQSAIDLHANSITNPHSVTKTQVGLANVDNTSDASKPVSTTQQAELDKKTEIYQVGHPFATGSTTSGHIITASSIFSASFDGWKAFQEFPVAASEWATASQSSATLVIELPQSLIFSYFTAVGRTAGDEYPTRWKLEGSNDGTTYTTLLDKTAADESLQTEKTFNFINTVPYKFYRFNMTNGVGTNIGLSKVRWYRNLPQRFLEFGQ